jgi:blocked-early-in-transport protein 1
MARRQPFHYGGSVNNGYQANGGQQPSYQQSMDHQMDANDDLIDGLVPKVSMLKSLALDMGDEIKVQNSLLNRMDHEFDSTWGYLSNSMAKVKKLAGTGYNMWYFYMIGFTGFVFFFIWMIR